MISFIRQLLVVFLFILLAVEAGAISRNGDVRPLLLKLQRQGLCRELPQFGVSTHRGRNPDSVNVGLVSDLKAGAVRIDVPWSDSERGGRYDFGPYDDLIGRLRQNGKSIILVLAYGHPDHSDGRAENGFPLPPRSPEQRAAYDKYAQAVASRYHGPDIVYEIWNEPNLGWFWPPGPDADAYGKLLAEATKAIRDVAPTATIILGGLANENSPPAFLHALAKAGTLDGLDGITFHPYRKDAPENSLYDTDEFENGAAGHNGRPLWITEWGYSESWLANTSPYGSRQRSAVMIARLMLASALAKAKAAIVYDLIDDGKDPNDQESSFGLFDYDFKPKPAATAFRTIAGLMSDCIDYDFKVDTAQNVVTAAFRFQSSVSYVVWTYAADQPRDVCFAAPDIRPTELRDVSDKPLSLESCGENSQIKLNISEASGPMILRGESLSSK